MSFTSIRKVAAAPQLLESTSVARAGRDLQGARRRHPRPDPRRALAVGALRLRPRAACSASASRPSRISCGCCAACGSCARAAPAGWSSTRSTTSTSSALRAGPRARAGTRSVARRRDAARTRWPRTCTVCELHAESTFKVEGMDCREEVALLERRFKHLPGLEDFSADLIGPAAARQVRRGEAVGSAIAAAVADAGMRAWLEHEEPIATAERRRHGRASLLAISGRAARRRTPGATAARRRRRRCRPSLFGALARGRRAPDHRARPGARCALRSLDINVLMLVAAVGRHRSSASGPRRPPSCSCSPLRRRSKRARSSARGSRSAR